MNKPDINLNGCSIISFDIFDTLLTRRVVHPFGIFYQVQEKLMMKNKFDSDFIRRFVQIRIEAEARAKKKFKKNQADFREIYQVICDDHGMGDAERDGLMALEFETELASICPIEPMTSFLKSVRNGTRKILFTTDMYLDSNYIRKILEHNELFEDGDTIYASSDVNKTKSTGKLFKHILQKENCSSKDIIHIGNNYDIDIAPARRNGFSTYYYNQTDSTRFENLIGFGAHPSGPTASFFQTIAGASRLARIHNTYSTPEEKVYAEIGANFAGPLLYAFVSWILILAKRKKLKRLYFIARDGQILYQIAGRIRPFFYPDAELKYIYGSRQSWHLPSITEIGERELEWLLDPQPFLTLGAFAKRVTINGEFLQTLFKRYSGKTKSLDAPLSLGEINILRDIILSSELSGIILACAEAERKKVLAYYAQEGLVEPDTPYGIVDMGWAGRLQESLMKTLSAADCRPDVTGFYFGLNRELEKESGKTNSYFFDPAGESVFFETGLRLISILEVITTADHASTVSFSEENGKYRPVFKSMLYDEKTLGWIKALRGGIFAFISNLDAGTHKAKAQNGYALKNRLLFLMDALHLSPTPEEAEYLGAFPYCTDPLESFSKDLAPKFTAAESFRFLFTRRNKTRRLTTHWMAGSRSRSGNIEKKILSPRIYKLRFAVLLLLRQIMKMIRSVRTVKLN